MTKVALISVAVSCAVLAGGCSSHHRAPPPPAKAVPLVAWLGATPRAFAVPATLPAAPCRVSQLRVVRGGFKFAATPEGGTGSAIFRNAGPGACRLAGRPGIRFVGAPRQPQQQQTALAAGPPPFPVVTPPASILLALPPGRSAAITIDWRNWCVPGARGATKPLTPPRAARVTLPGGGGSLDVPYDAVTRCDNPGRPSTIGVRPFQPVPLPSVQPWTTAGVTAKILTLSGAPPPLHGRRGQDVRYAVELRNRSAEAVPFTRCPVIAELLAPAGVQETHRLNCRGAHPLPAGGALRFEMRIHVPRNAPEGPNGLFWELDPLGSQQPEVVARLVVTP